MHVLYRRVDTCIHVYICIFLICTRFFLLLLLNQVVIEFKNLNINVIHIIFLCFFLYVHVWVRICWRRVLYFVSISAVLQFVCNVSEQKVIGEQHFLFSFKSNPRWNKLTSASAGLIQLLLVLSCFSNRKNSIHFSWTNQRELAYLSMYAFGHVV